MKISALARLRGLKAALRLRSGAVSIQLLQPKRVVRALIGILAGACPLAGMAAPTISSVAVPVDGLYGKNKPMEFAVTFSEDVNVTGFPNLNLDIGGVTRSAAYQSGSGSKNLVFRYSVQAGDADADGISISALSLAGAAIRNGASEMADVTLNGVASTSGILVETVAPQVVSVTRKNPSAQPTGARTVVFEAVFSEDVLKVSASQFQVTNVNGGTVAATVTQVTGGPRIYDVTVSITGGAGEFRLDVIK